MGKKDIVLTRYFEDDDRYADLLNGYIFCGKQVVSGEDIVEKNGTVSGIWGNVRRRMVFRKYRDLVRKVIFGTEFAVIGLENQDEIHYAMPVRIMLEDAAGYDEQVRQIQKRNKKRKGLKGAEFLGKFTRSDRISPVVSIVIYYGQEPWDGPKELYQMMECETIPEEIKGLINNYSIHVLEVNSYQELHHFKTDLHAVLGFIQRAGDKEAEKEFTYEHEDIFCCLEEDAFDVITALTGADELVAVKEKYMEGETVNMCEAIRGMIEDGRIEGRNEGRAEGLKFGRMEKSKTVAYNMFTRGMSSESAAAICEEDQELIEAWFCEWQSRRQKN